MLSLADFKTCVDKLPPDVMVSFSAFGEPQMNPAFTDMVLYAHSVGHPVELYSTLVGMTRESYQKIRDVPFRNVVLHIPDREDNSHFDLTPEYLELVNLVICDAMAGRFKIHAYSCHGEVHPAIVDLVHKSGIFIVSELHDRAGNVKKTDVKHTAHKKGRIWCARSGRKPDWSELLPDGTVCLCCMDFGVKYVLGNLLTQSYDQIMQGEAMRDLCLRMKGEKDGDCICRRCVFAENTVEHFIKWSAMRLVKLLFNNGN